MDELKKIKDDFSANVRGIDVKNREVDIIASTPKKDRHGSIIEQNGWELTSFKNNPVILFGHENTPAPFLGGPSINAGMPVAKANPETVMVVDDKLKMRIKFAETPFADTVFNLVQDGFINMVSVGFIPKQTDIIEDEDGNKTPVHKRMELLEVSIVSIPSNDEAQIVRMAKKLNRDVTDIKRVLVDFEKECKSFDVVPEGNVTISAKEYKKLTDYMEQKQPANKAASKVLKKFYDQKGEKAPANEIEAWEKMLEGMDVSEVKSFDDVVKLLEKSIELASKPVETPPEAKETPLQIPITSFKKLQELMQKDLEDVKAEALRKGVPTEDIPALLRKRTRELREEIKNGTSKLLSKL